MWHEDVLTLGTKQYWWSAKVYDNPSRFGINGGRVSKLNICRGPKWNHKQMIYNYDRGDDVDICPPEVLAEILEICAAFPARKAQEKEG